MKAGTADYLARAEECLDAARRIIDIQLPAVAAKEAYLAAYHAAQAFVFDASGKVAKTHSGMRTLFARAAMDDPALTPSWHPISPMPTNSRRSRTTPLALKAW
ncbi:HEPN domain-containing protein [Rhodopila globiformis]|uniref:HEPN domain-containing protein n=1 Tax=Rhodopila globiformis TaxID=1071 RepID=UPI001304F967